MRTVRTERRQPARIERHRRRCHARPTQDDSRDRRDRWYRTRGLPAPGRGRGGLLLAARDAARLQSLCAELPVHGPAQHTWISVDMTLDASVQQFADALGERNVILDGAVLMPPQDPPTADALPSSEKWREVLQNSFVGPLALLKAAIGAMRPDLAQGRRCKIVIVSGISSAQVLGHYASSNVIRCAWLAEAKTLAFALGERGIHVNTLSLGGTLTPGYTASLEKRAVNAGVSYGSRARACRHAHRAVPRQRVGEPRIASPTAGAGPRLGAFALVDSRRLRPRWNTAGTAQRALFLAAAARWSALAHSRRAQHEYRQAAGQLSIRTDSALLESAS